MKKAIKINVETKNIEEIALCDNYKDTYSAIGNGCSCFCVPVHYPNGDALYADDESLLRPNDIVGGFIMEGWREPIIGNAIILGTDDEGNSISCATRIEDIAEKIFFIDQETSRRYAESAFSWVYYFVAKDKNGKTLNGEIVCKANKFSEFYISYDAYTSITFILKPNQK